MKSMGSATRPIGSGAVRLPESILASSSLKKEQRQILEEGYQNGIERVCAAGRNKLSPYVGRQLAVVAGIESLFCCRRDGSSHLFFLFLA